MTKCPPIAVLKWLPGLWLAGFLLAFCGASPALAAIPCPGGIPAYEGWALLAADAGNASCGPAAAAPANGVSLIHGVFTSPAGYWLKDARFHQDGVATPLTPQCSGAGCRQAVMDGEAAMGCAEGYCTLTLSLPGGAELNLEVNGSSSPPQITNAYASGFSEAPPLRAEAGIPSARLTAGRPALPFTPLIASGGQGNLLFSIEPGLPEGLTLDAATGEIRGTPRAASRSSHVLRVADAAGSSASAEFGLTILAPARLISLTPSAGTLSPAFSPEGFTYVLTLPPGTESLSLHAAHDGAAATFEVDGMQSALRTGSTGPLRLGPGDTAARLLISNGEAETAYALTIRRAGKAKAQTIHFPAIASRPYSAEAFALEAAASSGLPVSFRSESPDTCAVQGTRLQLRAPGTCRVTASQPGDAEFDAAPEAAQSFTIGKALQPSLAVRASPLALQAGAEAKLAVVGGGGTGAVAFTLISGPCGLRGDTLSALNAGECVVSASKAADAIYEAASSAPLSIPVGRAAQGAFAITAPSPSLKVEETMPLAATGGAGAITFTLREGAAHCALDGQGMVTGLAAGSCTIAAMAEGDADHLPAQAQITLSVTPASQPELQLAADPAFILAGGSSTLIVSGGKGEGAVSFRLLSGPCVLKGSTLTGMARGECMAAATKAGDGKFTAQEARPILITVTGAVEPQAAEPNLAGSVGAQVQSTATLTSAQFANVAQRLEALRGARQGFAFDLGFRNADDALSWMPPAVAAARKADRLPFGHAADVNAQARAAWAGDAAAAPMADEPRLAGWINGIITHGSKHGDESFTTGGVTLGADMRLSASLTLGAGLGYGESRSDTGAHSGTDTQFFSAMAYGNWRIGAAGTLDFIAGLGEGRFRLERWSSGGSTLLTGERGARQFFGALRYGQEFEPSPGITLTPSLRLEALRMEMEGYTETGAPLWALRYGPMAVTSFAAIPGLKAEMNVRHPWGTLTPSARVEFRQALDGGYRQSFAQANFPGAPQAVEEDGSAKSALQLGLGLKAAGRGSWTADLGYGFTADLSGHDGLVSHSLEVTVRTGF